MISLANFNNSIQFCGESVDKSNEPETTGAEFSALLSAFCVATQSPATVNIAPSPPFKDLSEHSAAKVKSEIVNDLPDMGQLEHLSDSLSINKTNQETVEVEPTLKEKSTEQFALPASDVAMKQTSFSPAQQTNKADDSKIFSANKNHINLNYTDLNQTFEKLSEKNQTSINPPAGNLSENNLSENNLPKNVLPKNVLPEDNPLENSLPENNLLEANLPENSLNEKDVLAISDKSVVENIQKSDLTKTKNALLQFVEIQQNNLPQTLSISQLPDLPISYKFSVLEKPQKPIEPLLAPLQKIFQGIKQLPTKNFASSQTDAIDFGRENSTSDNLSNTETPVKNLVKDDFSKQIELTPKSEKSDFKVQNLIREQSAPPELIKQSAVRQPVALSLSEFQQTAFSPKAAVKIKENGLFETFANTAATLGTEQQSQSITKQTSRPFDLQTEISSLEQVKEAVFELTDKLNAAREPQIIKLRLRPAELGTVDIKLEQTKAGTINARLITTSESTSQIFSENISQLREALTETGWQIENLEVSCESFQNSSGFNNQNQQSPQALPEEKRINFLGFDPHEEFKQSDQINQNQSDPNRLLSVRA